MHVAAARVVACTRHFEDTGVSRALYERFFAALERLGCRIVRFVSSPVNKSSIVFHRRMGFFAEDSIKSVDGIPVFKGYDGRGKDRVVLMASLQRKKLSNNATIREEVDVHHLAGINLHW